jgi:type IV pilus assembly protein PilB
MKKVEEWVFALRGMSRMGEILFQRGKISKDQLDVALRAQKTAEGSGKMIGELLVEGGSLSENELLEVFSENLGIPYIQNLSCRVMETNGIQVTRETYDLLYKLCPLTFLEGEEYLPYQSEIVKNEHGNYDWNVYCFAWNPWDYVKIMQRFHYLLTQHGPLGGEAGRAGAEEFPLANVSHLNMYIALARRGDILRTIEELKEFGHSGVRNTKVESEYAVGRIFWDVVNFGIQTRCSDIHISPGNVNGGLVVRFRRDGDLAAEDRFSFGSEKFPMGTYEEFTNIIFNAAKMQGHEKNMMALDGSLQYSMGGMTYDMRIASIPVLMGQRAIASKITIRILYKSNTRDITGIGMLPEQLDVVRRLYAKSEGLTLLTGPTSCGKTTTIYAILNRLDLSRQCCYTIENPVEYDLPFASQIQVDEKSGLSFANILRNILRQDPDIVFVGEMRDKESVESVVHIANTGHTVLSTIHANSAYKVPQRLMNMGIAPHQMFSSLNLVISQRLVHRNCPRCLRDYKPTEFETRLLGLDLDEGYKHGTGMVDGETCPNCGGRGYVGRTGIFEILPVAMYPEWERYADTPESVKAFFTSMTGEDGKRLYPEMMDDARTKMGMGEISPKSLASVFSRLEIRD